MSFEKLLREELLFFDGGMGTQLQERGLKPGELPESWNLTHPEKVRQVHEAYIEAGANILTTNTFGAYAHKLSNSGYSVEQVVTAAVANAKEACAGRDKTFVALDLGPTGKLLAPFGDLGFEEAVAAFAQLVRAGVAAGADLILIETMSDSYEAKAAILAAKENSELPVLVSFSFDADGRLLNGADVATAFAMAEALGADVVGANCGLGPKELCKLVPCMVASTTLPIMMNPNAGMPVECNGKTVFDVGAEEFAEIMADMTRQGLAIVGGCCGTTPEYIRRLKAACRGIVPLAECCQGRTVLAGYSVPIVLGEAPVIIGERINPTGKPRLKEAIKNGDMDYICRLGLEQLAKGAQVLDVNVGVPGIDEPELLTRAVMALQGVTSVPLQIDTSNYEAMEKALRVYNGKPLLNSVNGKAESLMRVLPLAKKYGAAMVALCLDDQGIPETAQGRIAIAEKIIAQAAALGIGTENIIVDPLALTVSTGADNARVALEVIRTLRARGIHTVMGVSNISFGLPARDIINSNFFTLALYSGLSCAIINPQSQAMQEALAAYKALMGLDDGCKDFVLRFAQSSMPAQSAQEDVCNLYDTIVKGLAAQSCIAVERLLATEEPLAIINKYMLPALDYVGHGFEAKMLFLPQLLMSADAAKAAFEVVRGALAGKGNPVGQTIVLATVKGDIHDIGKNIVKALLQNYGYRIVDLGKDVEPEAIAAAAESEDARIVGLAALMTTTVGAMAETIRLLRQRNIGCKILVGGAVLTEEYAASIGADAYAANAVSAVNYAKDVLPC